MTDAERRVVIAVTCVLAFGACMRLVQARWPRAVPFAAARPAVVDSASARTRTAAPESSASRAPRARTQLPAAPVDVNTADLAALMTLPGIGPAKARAVIAERAKARFRSANDLLRVKGIGPATVRRLRPLIVF